MQRLRAAHRLGFPDVTLPPNVRYRDSTSRPGMTAMGAMWKGKFSPKNEPAAREGWGSKDRVKAGLSINQRQKAEARSWGTSIEARYAGFCDLIRCGSTSDHNRATPTSLSVAAARAISS